MITTYRVEIGGVAIHVEFPAGLDVTLPEVYKPFLSQKEPEIFVAAHLDRSGVSSLQLEPVFDTGPNWSLYKQNGKFIIRTRYVEAVCSPDFTDVDVYPLPGVDVYDLNFSVFTYPLPEVLMINFMARHGGLMLHSCGVIDHGKGFIFCGMSGAGKSTLANIWENEVSVTVLSDDRIIVQEDNEKIMAYGTPWHGDSKHSAAEKIAVTKFFFIEQAEENKVQELSRTDAVAHFMSRSFPPLWDKDGIARTLEFVDHLATNVPCYKLGVVPDKKILDFVRLA